ncbi:MAG: glycine zipper 2TM domain-containing protein [Gemmatimonadaceae bacterium]
MTSSFQGDLDAASVPTVAPPLRFPEECRAFAPVTSATRPTQIDSARAVWTRDHGLLAERHGDLRGAKSLFEASARLDPSDPIVEYHLGVVSESLRDRVAATRAYCSYLALPPVAREDSVRFRLRALRAGSDVAAAARLVRTTAAPKAGRVVRSAVAATPRAATGRPSVLYAAVVAPPPVTAEPTQPSTTTETSRGAVGSESRPEPAPAPVNETAGSTVTPPAPAPTTAPEVRRGSSVMTRDVLVGAGVGAVIGAAIGRDRRSTVIGGLAGVLLGAGVGASSRHKDW